MTVQSDKAQQALENYLDALFDDEPQDTIPPDSITDTKVTTETVHGRYHLGKDGPHPTHEQQHQIERVERLLEDYNNRYSKVDVAEHHNNVTLLRPVIETDIPTPLPDVNSEPETEVEHTEDSVTLPDATTELPTHQYERPEWSHSAFQALLFHVGGIELAVPLISLGGIHRLENDITRLFGKPDWFMGLTPGLNGNINMVDTCRWVMPDLYGDIKSKGLNYSFIIMLGDSQWGLACSHVENAITVEPDEVKWRGQHTRRPWLSGMLVERRVVLLDVEVLIDLLESNYQR